MRHIRVRGGDLLDLLVTQMDAMTEHRLRGQESALAINIGVIARIQVKVTHLFDLLAIFGQMSLQVSAQFFRQLRGAAHELLRAGDGKARAESIFQAPVRGAVPLPAQALALDERDRENLPWLERTVRTEVHHHLAENNPETAPFRGLESNVAAVLVDRSVDHRGGGAVARQLLKKQRRFLARFWSGELAFHRKNAFP